MSSYRNYYDSTFGRRADSAGKSLPEPRATPSRIATKYGGNYTSGIGSTRDSCRPDPPRIKTYLDKDTSHPPVSYKSPLARSSARSRDPSPSLDKSEKSTSSSSGYLNPNRLYPKPYTKNSTSRESTVSPAGNTSNLPRLSTNSGKRDDSSNAASSKYGSSRTSSASKDSSISSKYKSSREDLSSGSQKYLNSRFLPKNSVERSFTAYTRPSSVRTHEVSRKNKELLSVLHAQQEQERLSSRPASRCSSVAPEDIPKKSPEKELPPAPKVELETLKVCTRGTSPTLGSSTQPSFLRSRRMELAKTIEKTITRPKTIKENMADKGIQSDRLDDSTRSSRFAGASRISATPWTNFLDMKFSSPSNKKGKNADSPKSLSRTSSTKSIVSVKSDQDKDAKKGTNTKSKLTPPKQLTDKKQLPPPIPKSESSSKTNSLHSLNTTNKDFRKSVLNMNPDGSKKKVGRRSNSASSAESDNADPDATDISENLNSCKSCHNTSSSSMLSQKAFNERQRSKISPSSDVSVGSTTGPSSSEDDSKSKKERIMGVNLSRTSVLIDDISLEKPSKIPQSSKLKPEANKNETEAKNFLMRALAPVTNLFKANRQSQANIDIGDNIESEEKVVRILDPSSDSTNEQNSGCLEPKSAKLVLHRVESDRKGWWEETSENSSDHGKLQQMSEPVDMKYDAANHLKQDISGEAPWWLDANHTAPEGTQIYSGYNAENNMSAPLHKPSSRHVESGETPWWLDENAQTPEGVQTYPNWTAHQTFPLHQSQQPMMKDIRSGEKAWWLEESPSEVPEGVQAYPNWIPTTQEAPPSTANEEQIHNKPKIRSVESGEAPWWLQKESSPPEGIQTYPDWVPEQTNSSKFKRHDSGNSTWWQDSDKSSSENRNISSSEPGINQKQPELFGTHKLRHIDSGERAWWINDDESSSEMLQPKEQITENTPKYAIRHQDSGERAWWLENNQQQEFDNQEPLGDRASPEGIEMPKDNEGRLSPYDNVPTMGKSNRKGIPPLFISKHTNIDDILGGTGQLWSPLMNQIFRYGEDGEVCREINAKDVIIHEGRNVEACSTNRGIRKEAISAYNKRLDDAALQLYKDGDYGAYLDLEASISEQQEEFEGFQSK